MTGLKRISPLTEAHSLTAAANALQDAASFMAEAGWKTDAVLAIADNLSHHASLLTDQENARVRREESEI